ncbi:hypothetical protein C8Q79DRAFT_521355 [Trametes meyenii]|nr:hypothetical protein C8Q79DRAFT_521355 [Trametes meyenii]
MKSWEINVSFELKFQSGRGPISLCYPRVRPANCVKLSTLAVWYEQPTLRCFELFPETPRIVSFVHERHIDDTAFYLFFLWPVVQAGWEALLQFAYLSVGWAILYVAFPSDPGYATSSVVVMQAGAVGGAILYAVQLCAVLFLRIRLFWTRLPQPKEEEPKPMSKRSALLHIASAMFNGVTEVGGAAAAGAVGACVLHSADPESMDVSHAVRASTLGAAVLYVPQAVWFLVSAYWAWREAPLPVYTVTFTLPGFLLPPRAPAWAQDGADATDWNTETAQNTPSGPGQTKTIAPTEDSSKSVDCGGSSSTAPVQVSNDLGKVGIGSSETIIFSNSFGAA